MDKLALLKDHLESSIGNMEFNLGRYEESDRSHWPWPGTYEEAKGKLQGYREILAVLPK